MERNALSRRFTAASLLRFSAANVVMMIFLSLYTIVDGMFISRLVGTLALSAVNMSYPLNSLELALGIMLGTGASAVIAREMGAGEAELARRDFSCVVTVAAAAGGVFALAPGLPLCQLRQLPVRAQALPEPSLSSLRYQDEGEDLLVFVTARSFCHGLHFDLPDRVRADELYFDLLPASSARLRFQGQAGARPAPRFVRPPQETSSCPPQG